MGAEIDYVVERHVIYRGRGYCDISGYAAIEQAQRDPVMRPVAVKYVAYPAVYSSLEHAQANDAVSEIMASSEDP